MVTPTIPPPSTITYSPKQAFVSSITNANPAVVTTATQHGFSTGDAIRTIVPAAYGMQILNNRVFIITVLSPTTFSLQISQQPIVMNANTLNAQPFVIPAITPSLEAQVLCIGSLPTNSPVGSPYYQTLVNDQVVNVGA